MNDTSVFPDPVYQHTVLAPLFEGVKTHYATHMAAINRAHLVMLVETGVIESDEATRIADALTAIDNDTALHEQPYTGEHEDYFFVVEHELKRRLGADTGGLLHTARSRNDMDHTMFRMALREHTDQMLHQALALADTLLGKARDERDTLIVAYTHGQPAQPATFGHYLCAVLETLNSDIERLLAARTALDLCPMGAAAITTSGFPIDRHRMAELLGFSAPKRNSYACIASVDYITGLYAAIKLMFVHLGRVFQDMAFWSAFEVGQLYVPNSLVQISSIMPQKRNPVPIEHLRHLASVTAGRCDTLIDAMRNTPFTDMNDSEGEVQSAGYSAFKSGARVLQLTEAFFASVSINADRVQANADAACVTITELADTLVRTDGLSFRQAHEIAADTARAVIADGQPLARGYRAFAAAFETHIGRRSALDQHSFEHTVSLDNFVSLRDRYGGPAASALDEAFEHHRSTHDQYRRAVDASGERLQQSEQQLNTAFQSVLAGALSRG